MKETRLFQNHDARRWGLMWMMVIGLTIGCKDTDIDDDPLPVQKVASVYVANESGQSITVIDAVHFLKTAEIDVSDSAVSMAMPHNVQVAPDGKTVWCTSVGMNLRDVESVVVIDRKTNAIMKRIPIGTNLHLAHVVLDDASEYAYVTANSADKVYKIDAISYSVVDSFKSDAMDGPHGMRYHAGKLYIANMVSKNMSIIDVATGQFSNIALGGIAVQTAVTADARYAFASLFDTKEVARYTISTGQVIKIELPSISEGPIQIYPTPNCKYLYVCDQGGLLARPNSNKVFVIDIENAEVVSTVTVGNKVHGVVLSNDGKYAFVTNSADNTVSVIKTSTQTVVATIPTGDAPNGIAYGYETGGMH